MRVDKVSSGNMSLGNMSSGNMHSSTKKQASDTYRQIMESKMEQMSDVIANGSTEQAIQSGGNAYTQSEWDEMLDGFDASLEDAREQMREEHERRLEDALQKETEDFQ